MTPTHVDSSNRMWASGITGIENNYFDLVLIQQQWLARHTTLDVGGARLVSREVNIKLSVIGIHMIFQVVSKEYGSEWHAVDGKQ